jgi:flavin-dependent dehydrogenase
MAKRYDLIVVGAGPAGLVAAKTAAEKGLDVALFERKKDPSRITRPCSEILPLNEDFYGEHTRYDPKSKQLSFVKSGFSVTYDGKYRDIETFRLYSMDGACIRMVNSVGRKNQGPLPVQMVFEKGTLLEGLLREAKGRGVHVFTNSNIASLEKKRETVKVISSEGKEYEGVFAIAADGVNSRVAERLGFNKTRKFYGTLRGLAWHVRGVRLPAADAQIHIEGGEEVSATFSINPRVEDDEYFIYVGGLRAKVDLNSWTDHIMRKSGFSSWFRNSKEMRGFSVVANIYSPIDEPFKDNVLLVGDAAYTLQVTNTGALTCGWKAGSAMSKALCGSSRDRDGVDEYLSWWHKSYCGCDHTAPYPLRGDLGAILSSDELSYFIGLFKEPLPFSSNPFVAARNMSEAMEAVVPRLQKERPEIMERLARFKHDELTELMDDSIKAGFPNR